MSDNLTAQECEELRRLAQAATPGPWALDHLPTVFGQVDPSLRPGDTVLLGHAEDAADARFIAAANPQVILALLDRTADLEARLAEARATIETLRVDRCCGHLCCPGGIACCCLPEREAYERLPAVEADRDRLLARAEAAEAERDTWKARCDAEAWESETFEDELDPYVAKQRHAPEFFEAELAIARREAGAKALEDFANRTFAKIDQALDISQCRVGDVIDDARAQAAALRGEG